jgi:hypothetical protein
MREDGGAGGGLCRVKRENKRGNKVSKVKINLVVKEKLKKISGDVI